MIIYIIYPKLNKDIRYVGSSSRSLEQRKYNHKSAVNNKNSHLYQYIKNNGGMENFEMEVFEEFEGNEKDLKKREGDIIQEFKNDPELYILNKRIEGRTKKEYYLQNRQEKLDKAREYYYKNKEAVSQKRKTYYQNNRDKLIKCSKERYNLLKQSTPTQTPPS